MTSATCNLDCSYCYMRASRQNTGSLKKEDLESVIKNCSVGFDSVRFHWHGGEPLLAGKSFYEEVLRVQNDLARERPVTFSNRIQTNGVLLTPELVDFFIINKFHVGLSIDAPRDVYPLHRLTEIDPVLMALSLLKDRRVPVGALCVISKLNVGRARDIFDFYKSIGVKSFGLLPLKEVPLDSMPQVPTEDDLFNLFRDMLELWMYEENCFHHIEPISTMIEGVVSGIPTSCSFAASCLGRMITIDQNGYIVPCASLVSPEFVLGDSKKERLIDVIEGQAAGMLRLRRADSIDRHCLGCEFLDICNGGCRAEAYWHTGDYGGKAPSCGVRKRFFQHIRDVVKERIMPQIEKGG